MIIKLCIIGINNLQLWTNIITSASPLLLDSCMCLQCFLQRKPHLYVGEYGDLSHVQSRHKIILDLMMLLARYNMIIALLVIRHLIKTTLVKIGT